MVREADCVAIHSLCGGLHFLEVFVVLLFKLGMHVSLSGLLLVLVSTVCVVRAIESRGTHRRLKKGIPTVDGQNPAPLSYHGDPFAGICRGMIRNQGLLGGAGFRPSTVWLTNIKLDTTIYKLQCSGVFTVRIPARSSRFERLE